MIKNILQYMEKNEIEIPDTVSLKWVKETFKDRLEDFRETIFVEKQENYDVFEIWPEHGGIEVLDKMIDSLKEIKERIKYFDSPEVILDDYYSEGIEYIRIKYKVKRDQTDEEVYKSIQNSIINEKRRKKQAKQKTFNINKIKTKIEKYLEDKGYYSIHISSEDLKNRKKITIIYFKDYLIGEEEYTSSYQTIVIVKDELSYDEMVDLIIKNLN